MPEKTCQKTIPIYSKGSETLMLITPHIVNTWVHHISHLGFPKSNPVIFILYSISFLTMK